MGRYKLVLPRKSPVAEKPEAEQPKAQGDTRNTGAASGGDASARFLDEAVQASISNFSKIDADGDKFLTPKEVDDAVTGNKVTGKDAAALALLKMHGEIMQTISKDELSWNDNDGVTREDLTKFASGASASLKRDAGNTVKAARQSLDFATADLFAGKDAVQATKPEAVVQGASPDCFFLATVSSMAKSKPEELAKLITDNKNGTYTVTFPGDSAHPVTVKRPNDAELAVYAKASEHGIWAPVLEKAFMNYLEANPEARRKALSEDDVAAGGTGRNVLASGGRVTFAMELLTGKSVSMIMPSAGTDGATVAENVSGNLGKALPVVAAVEKGNAYAESLGLPTGYHHAYSVLGYDPQTQTYTIRNPYGKGEPTSSSATHKDGVDDGTFKLTRDQFVRCFNEVYLANDSPKHGATGGLMIGRPRFKSK